MPQPRSENAIALSAQSHRPSGPGSPTTLAPMFPTLRDFLAALERAGELRRVAGEVSPLLDIAEIADRVSKSPCAAPSKSAAQFDLGHAALGGHALLFERVADCDFPLAINVFGSYRRMEMALGVAERGGFEAIAARIASLTKPQPPRSLREVLAKGREFLPLLRIPPRTVRSGRCQEVVKLTSRGEVDLRRLPIIQCWPLDGDPRQSAIGLTPRSRRAPRPGAGRYITLAGMHTIHADDRDSQPSRRRTTSGCTGRSSIDATQLAMHWHMHHDGAAHWRSWKKLGKPMPIAIVLGGESRHAVRRDRAAAPGNLRAAHVAGFLNGRRHSAGRRKTVPLRVPANSRDRDRGLGQHRVRVIGWDPRAPAWRSSRSDPAPCSRARSATTPGSTRCPTATPIVEVTASHPSRGTRSTRPPSSACRRKRTTTSAKPPSGCSCRC
jgi:4-hydroxy-3-polyprenylbenzoate decarboxylase